MHLSIRRLAAVAGGCLFVAGLALRLPPAAASLLGNIALLRVVVAPGCDPGWFVCTHTPWGDWYPPQRLPDNAEVLAGTVDWLQQAEAIAPANRRMRLHEAETLFALGERGRAADILSEAGWPASPDPDPASSSLSWPAGSPLLTVGRYEYYLIRGHQWATAGQWPQAVRDYQFGLAYAGERASDRDRNDFFLASAKWHAGQAEVSLKQRELAGKYFALAGEWDVAIRTLQPLLADGSTLSAGDRAWVAYYLGRAYEGAGDAPSAIAAYWTGWQISPEVRENGIQLSSLLGSRDPAVAAEIAAALEAAGPAYRNGRFAPGYEFPVLARLPSGLVFVGYDVDAESVENSPALDVWLWWKKPAGAAQPTWDGPGLVDLGEHVLQRQTITNLVLNSAFEWGEQPNGVPLGWHERMYTDTPESLYVAATERDGQQTHALVGANTVGDSTGLRGFNVPVQNEGWYLMAGWMNLRRALNSGIGRICIGPEVHSLGPYYPAWPPTAPDGVWTHLADLAPALPADRPDECLLILVNVQDPGGRALWDDLLFARIVPPS